VLEEENLIEPSSQGAITTERTHEFVDELDENSTRRSRSSAPCGSTTPQNSRTESV